MLDLPRLPADHELALELQVERTVTLMLCHALAKAGLLEPEQLTEWLPDFDENFGNEIASRYVELLRRRFSHLQQSLSKDADESSH